MEISVLNPKYIFYVDMMSVTHTKTHTSSLNSDTLNFPLLDRISQAPLWVFQRAV